MSLSQVLLDYVKEACDQLQFEAPGEDQEEITYQLGKRAFIEKPTVEGKEENVVFFISANNRIVDEVIDSEPIDLRGLSVDGWFATVEDPEWLGEAGRKEFRLAWVPPVYVSDLASLIQARLPRSTIRHTTCDLYTDTSDEEEELGQLIARPPLRVVHGTGMELVKLFLMTAVPWEDKAGNILVHLFPYIQQEAMTRAVSYTIDEYYQLLGLVKQETSPSDRDEKTSRALAVAGMACLLHSWNIKDKVKSQLLRRVNAMAASLNIPPIKEEDLSRYMDNAGYSSAKGTGWLTDLTGMIVARDNEWAYNLDTAVTQLGDPALAKLKHECTDLAVAALVQMRLVFSGFQTSTARSTATLYQLMKNNQVTVTPTLRSDFEYFDTIYKRIVNAPYCGLCARPSDAFQIRLYPRLAYSALLYHGKQLTAESSKKDWDKYSIKEIAAHIGSLSEKSVCEYFVQTLPSSFLYALAELIETMPFQDAEIAVSTLTAVQKGSAVLHTHYKAEQRGLVQNRESQARRKRIRPAMGKSL